MRVTIDDRLILDVHGFTSILECVETLFVVGLCWADASDHVCVRIASQTVLEDTSQFRVAEGYEVSLLPLQC